MVTIKDVTQLLIVFSSLVKYERPADESIIRLKPIVSGNSSLYRLLTLTPEPSTITRRSQDIFERCEHRNPWGRKVIAPS